MMNTKVCLVGYGSWGKVLYKKLKLIFNVKYILSRKNYSLKKIRDVEWVIIATSDASHYKVAKESLKLKKNVFCEKPLTKKLKQAKYLYKLANENRVKLIVSDLSEFKPRIKLSQNLNTFKRFKNSLKDQNLNSKRYDLLYRFAYHDIGYIYDFIKNKKLNSIKINSSKIFLDFSLKYNNTKFLFTYHTKKRKKHYSLNKKNMSQKNDIIKKMFINYIVKNKGFNRNKQKSLFIINNLEKIKNKII